MAKEEEKKKEVVSTSEDVKKEGQDADVYKAYIKGEIREIEEEVEDPKAENPEAGFYAIQTKDGKDDWIFLRKGNGKIAKASKKGNALEVMNKILDKRGDSRARVVFAENVKGEKEPAIKTIEAEMTKDGRTAQRKNEIPKELIELYGKERVEQLSFMDENERGAVLHLLQQVQAKQEELNTFGILAAQRSGFRGNKKKLESLEKLKGRIAKAKTKREQAQEEYDTAGEAGKLFAEKQMKEYPHLYKWIMEQLGVVETTTINSKTRRRAGAGAEGGKKSLILKMFREQEGQGKRLKPSDISKIMKAKRTPEDKPLDGVWEQYAIANPIKSLKLDGYLAEDDERRYYIP